MYCSKCGKEVLENSRFCSNCGTEIIDSNNIKEKQETVNKTKLKVNKKVIFSICVTVSIVLIVAILLMNKDSSNLKEDTQQFEQTSANIYENGVAVSFNNMNADDEGLDNTKKEILKYFDNDYFTFYYDVENLQRYPQIFENSKICIGGGVVKVLSSTNEEFEVLMCEDESGYYFGPNKTGEFSISEFTSSLFIIKGAQLNQRLMANDYAEIRGRYVGVETREIDGISYTLPVVNVINVNYYDEEIYDISTIRTVAEHIFGSNIKITQPEPIVNTNIDGSYLWEEEPQYYLVTLDNQSNANFKSFNMSKTEGVITYNKEHNNLSDSIQKRLFISSDFNHFIVTTYDSNLKYVYIDYFDKELNKLWSREFQYNSNAPENVSPIDYTSTYTAFVIDNDLYLINTETGENIIDPVLVGAKTKVIMMSDGIILIGEENKDLIMKVDFKGNVLYRIDGDTNLSQINYTRSQIVNGNLLLNVVGINENVLGNSEEVEPSYIEGYVIEKYMVITNDGTVEFSTKDLDTF